MGANGFFDILRNNPEPVLVDFHATWCGPCKMQDPVIRQVSTDMKGKVRILKVDIDKNPSVARHFQITGVPTLILFKKGDQVWRQSGVVQKHHLEQVILNNQ